MEMGRNLEHTTERHQRGFKVPMELGSMYDFSEDGKSRRYVTLNYAHTRILLSTRIPIRTHINAHTNKPANQVQPNKQIPKYTAFMSYEQH